MPKVTLEFQLPEEHEEFELANNGARCASVVHDLDQYLRAKLKYDNTLTDEQHKIYQEIRDKLWELRHE